MALNSGVGVSAVGNISPPLLLLVWNTMVWYGMVWDGSAVGKISPPLLLVWNSMIWYDMIWCSMVWDGLILPGV